MKTIKLFIEILALLFIGLASTEIKADNINGAFVDVKNPTQIVTEGDVQQIAYYIDRDQIVAGKWYTLNSGLTFKMENPTLWKKTMTEILTKVKGGQITSIQTELSTSQILDWDDNISTKTKNYHMKGGKLGFVDNYSGGSGVRVVVYKGYPVLKVGKPCFNPNEPHLAQSNNLDQGFKDKDSRIVTETEKPCTEWYEYDSVTRVFFAPKEEETESYSYFRQNYTPWVPWGDYTGYYGMQAPGSGSSNSNSNSRSSSNSNSNGNNNNKDCKCTCDPFPKAVLKTSYSIHVKRLVPCGQQGERTVCLTLVEEPKQTKKKRGGFWRFLGRIFFNFTFTGGSNAGSGGLGSNDRVYPGAISNGRVYPAATTNDRVYPPGLH